MLATTIEQSQRLLELGLDPKSADMCWVKDYIGQWVLITDTQINIRSRFEEMYEHSGLQWQEHIALIPAWSLSALLEVMQKETLPALEYREGNKEWEANVWINHNIHCISHYDKLCAAYSMVCWLIEQGLIKKGGQD